MDDIEEKESCTECADGNCQCFGTDELTDLDDPQISCIAGLAVGAVIGACIGLVIGLKCRK